MALAASISLVLESQWPIIGKVLWWIGQAE
jgi:hypothetical protein